MRNHSAKPNKENYIENQLQIKLPIILKELMYAVNISEAELARQTDLPQATINRILLGGTKDPRASTLKAIASYFAISVDQLLGDTPLATPAKGAYKSDIASAVAIPIITWEDVPNWFNLREMLNPNNHSAWLTIDHKVNNHCFCVPSLRSMEPKFLTGSLLIIDPDREYRDGSYIIVLNQDKLPCIRRVLIQNAATYLAWIDQSLPPYPLLDSDHVVGTIIESRIDLR